MSLVTTIACLLAWGEAPVVSHAPGNYPRAREGPSYEVMQIRSGVEIAIRQNDGKMVIIRLVGIDTPRISPEAMVDVLSQKQHLRGLIGVGDQVYLETEVGAKVDDRGPVLAHVHRASDGVWLNLELAEQGFATIPATYVSRAQPALAAAEGRARDAGRGMWASDYLDHAVQLTQFRAPKKPRPRQTLPRRSTTPTPMTQTIVQVPIPVHMPYPVASGPFGYGGNSGYGVYSGYSGYSGGVILFDKDEYGRSLSPEQIRERVRSFDAYRAQQQANLNNVVNSLNSSLRNAQGVTTNSPEGVATNSPNFTPSIPIHNNGSSPVNYFGSFSNSNSSGNAGSSGNSGIPAAGHFNGFSHGQNRSTVK